MTAGAGTVEAKAHGELIEVVEKLSTEVRDERKSMSEKHDSLEAMHKELTEQLKRQERRAIFPEASMELFDGSPQSFQKNILGSKVMPGKKNADLMLAVQQKADEVHFMEAIRRACLQSGMDGTPKDFRQTKYWQEYRKLLNHVAKAAQDFDGDTTDSADWIPTDTSGNLREWVMMEMRVAALFGEFTMPTPTFDWPYVTGPPAATYVAEVDQVADAFTAPTAADQMFGGSDPAAKNTFNARKIRAFSFYSREWSEDTIAATLPWLMRQLPLSVGRAWEDAIINGDEGATLDDTNHQGAALVDRWFDGLRDYVIQEVGTWVGDTTDTHAYRFAANMTAAAWVLAEFADGLRAQRKKMDKYGLLLRDLVYVVDINCYYQLMSLPNFQTLDKLGSKATLLTGQVGAFDSIPVVVSEFMELLEANGTPITEDGTRMNSNVEDSGSNLLIYRPGWIKGRRPGMGAEVVRYAHTDSYMVVVFERGDFGPLEPSGTGGALTASLGYDIPVF